MRYRYYFSCCRPNGYLIKLLQFYKLLAVFQPFSKRSKIEFTIWTFSKVPHKYRWMAGEMAQWIRPLLAV